MRLPRFLLPVVLALATAITVGAQVPSWTSLPGFPGGTIHELVADSIGRVYARAQRGMYRSSDDGRTWIRVDAYRLAVAPSGALLRVDSYTVDRSTDGGETWEIGGAVSGSEIEDFGVFAVAPWGSAYLIEWHGLHRSNDEGRTWNFVGNAFLNNFSIGFGDDRSIYTGTEGSIAFLRNDGGAWGSGTLIVDDSVHSLLVSAAGTILAGTGGSGVIRSTDRGETSKVMRTIGDLDGATVHSIVQLPGGAVYLTTHENGIYRSLDDGLTWSAANEGIDDVRNFNALVLTRRNWLFAGGADGRLYRLDATAAAPPTSVANSGPRVVASDGRRLIVEVPAGVVLTVGLSSVDGRLVDAREYERGAGTVEIDLSSLASGCYLYRLGAGGGVATGVVMVID